MITNLSIKIKCKGHYGPKADLGDVSFCDPRSLGGYICGDCFAICKKHLDAIGMTYEEIDNVVSDKADEKGFFLVHYTFKEEDINED